MTQLGVLHFVAKHLLFNSLKILLTTMRSSCFRDIARHTSCLTMTFRYETYASLLTINVGFKRRFPLTWCLLLGRLGYGICRRSGTSFSS